MTPLSQLQVFNAMHASPHARLEHSAHLGDGLAAALWSNRDDARDYQAPSHHTLSCYIADGTGTHRRQRPADKGAPDKLCIMPAGQESNWVVNGSIRLAHLYISEAQFALGCVRLLDREPREVQLQEATFLDDPQQSVRFRQLITLDWDEPAERLLASSLAHEIVDHALLGQVGLRQGLRLKGGLAPNLRRQLVDYIEAHLDQPITLGELALRCNLSAPSTLSKTALFASSLATAGSVAWYGHLYGLPSVFQEASANAADEGLHPPAYPWSHKGPFETFDHASIRRGYQVYREVCAACHSLNRIAWRNLVGVSHTVDEVKAMAEEVEYTDGPNDEGEMFERPGKLADYMPAPYPNDEAARAGNNGGLPPDLSLMVKARHGGADYVYSLLTGYVDPPPGVTLAEGMNYNPYFPGGGIAMARVLYDGLVEYEDGTPATTSQMAKDVTVFLNWSAEPEHDQRKKMGMQAMIIFSALFTLSIYVKKFKWAGIKNRKLFYNPPGGAKH